MKTKKKNIFLPLISLLLALMICVLQASASVPIDGEEEDVDVNAPALSLNCKSAVLMEAETGKILYAQNENEALPPASVTKVMTLLLCMEEIAEGRLSLSDTVTASAYASSMGGSQIFLKEGEQMSVEDMLKSVVIASANDAAVALAEHICGSEQAFVDRMNERARELGMENTSFENTNGLDDSTVNHLTSALDIALMSRELCKHKKIFEYSSTWTDSIRNGEFGLTNTNRLIRFYPGATGLKTGSTAKAGFCISATAERGGLSLIAVIMGSESRDSRNESAKTLFDYGFANYSLYTSPTPDLPSLKIIGGKKAYCSLYSDKFSALIPKGSESKVEVKINLPESLKAPINAEDAVGECVFTLNGEEIGRCSVFAEESVEKISYLDLLCRICARFLFSSAE